MSRSDLLSLAAKRNIFGNTTKFYSTRRGFHVKIYNDNKITGSVTLWRGKATCTFLNLKVLLPTSALLKFFFGKYAKFTNYFTPRK